MTGNAFPVREKEGGRGGAPSQVRGTGFAIIACVALAFFAVRSGSGAFSWRWLPAAGEFGILAMLGGSVILSLVAVAVSWPLALGFSCLILTTRSAWARCAAGWLVRLMASIPTVVYGFASVFLLVPLVRKIGGGGTGLGLLTAALVLSLLIFPTLVVVMRASLRDRMAAVWLGAAGLGFSRTQALAHLVVPAARRGLAAAAVLGFARALGDTMIALMLAGNAAQLPTGFTDSLRTLTAHIALIAANEAGGAVYESLFVAGALLISLSCGVGAAVRRLGDMEPGPSRAQPSRLAHLFRDALAACLPWLGRAEVVVVFVPVAVLAGFVAIKGLPAMGPELFFGSASSWDAILGRVRVWDGIWPACVGTLCLVLLSLAFALPPGIGGGVYMAERAASGRGATYLERAVDMLASVPSIVMGLSGFMLILLLRRTLLPGANTCLLLSALCLSLLITPSLVVATRSALEALPDSLRLTAGALGFSPAQRIWHVLLPAAAPGILGGVILALGRAAEDTAVIMLTGVVANAGLPGGVLDKFEALPFSIYYTAAQYADEFELARAFGSALILVLVSVCLFAATEMVKMRLGRRWRMMR